MKRNSLCNNEQKRNAAVFSLGTSALCGPKKKKSKKAERKSKKKKQAEVANTSFPEEKLFRVGARGMNTSGDTTVRPQYNEN